MLKWLTFIILTLMFRPTFRLTLTFTVLLNFFFALEVNKFQL